MNKLHQPTTIAYLAPEIPALSATFVYEEMLGLQRMGYTTIPISVHKPLHPANGQEEIFSRTHFLYDQSAIKIALTGVIRLATFGFGALRALRMLLSDLVKCGLHRHETWKLAYQFLAAVKLAIILKSYGCSHLHVHFAHVPSQIAMYAAAMTGIPFTIMAHANDIFERGLLLQQKAERAVKMLTISEFNRAYLEEIGVSKEKLAVVRCGVSFPIYIPDRPFQKQNHFLS